MSKTGTRESKRTSSQIWSWMRNIGIFALLYLIVQAILQSEIESFWNSSVKPALSLEVKFALSVWQIGLALLVTVAVCSIGLYVTVTRFKLGRIQNELPKRQSFDLLTEQERQILQLRVGGYSPQEIAQRLNITKINQVLKSVYGKINAKDEVQAILWYYQLSVSEDSNSLDQPNSETFAWTDRADPSTHVFIVSYIVGYLALMVFLYLPRTFLSLEKVQGFWDDYAGMYFVLPLAAGLYNLYRFWNSESSPFQKESLTSFLSIIAKLPPLFFLSIGLILWGIGQACWMAYNIFLNIPEPYPSPADWGYTPCGILWLIGVYRLKQNLETNRRYGRLPSVVILLILLTHTIVLVTWARDGQFSLPKDPWKIMLDFYYPLVNALDLCMLFPMAYLAVSDDIESNQLRKSLQIILIGVAIWYVADTGFSVTTSLPEEHIWSFTSGNWVDFSFACAFLVVGIGISLLPTTRSHQPQVSLQNSVSQSSA